MVIIHTHAQRASKAVMASAGVNYLDMLSKYRLAGQKRRCQLQIWEAQRYIRIRVMSPLAVHCCSAVVSSEVSASLFDRKC